jgi:hypothetical protein
MKEGATKGVCAGALVGLGAGADVAAGVGLGAATKAGDGAGGGVGEAVGADVRVAAAVAVGLGTARGASDADGDAAVVGDGVVVAADVALGAAACSVVPHAPITMPATSSATPGNLTTRPPSIRRAPPADYSRLLTLNSRSARFFQVSGASDERPRSFSLPFAVMAPLRTPSA